MIICRDAVFAYIQPSDFDQRIPLWLLKHGANPDIRDGFGTSSMYYIAGYAPLLILQLLVEYGAKVDSEALFAVTRVKKRHDAERIPTIEFLISKGADVNFLHEYDRRPTGSALVYGRRFRHTLLWEAVRGRDMEMVELLIGHGADVSLRILVNGEEKSSPLEEMLASKHKKTRHTGKRFGKGESIA
jgi:ankyrin repeat protein